MVALKQSLDNRCRFCTKVFCCSECRDAHEDKKHPELNSSKPKCPLCFKFDLPYDPRLASSDSDFVCHVVINHLPLRCKICGEKFDSNPAFQSAQPCKGPTKKPPPPEPTTTPLLSLPRPIDSKVTPIEKKLPLTPQYHSIEASSVADKSANLKLNPESHFDSPPELARHTSTPMHLSVVSLQKHHSHPPEFNLKTPAWQRTFDSTTGSSTCGSAVSVSGESRYFTARLSLEGSSNNSASARENQGTPTWSSPVYPILKKQLEKQNSADDSPTAAGASYRVAERSILKSALLSRIDDSTRDSIEKRVRFSDQFETPASSKSIMADTSACDNDNDVFFEARESLDEEEVKDNSPVVQEVEEKKAEMTEDNGESKVNASTASMSSASSSSRVVMMLLVEKTTDSATGFSSLDLAPLIDSGLKKLEESAASIDNSKSENGTHNPSTGTIAKATTEVTSYTRQIDGSFLETSKGCRRRASIKDTFVTRTDRIECINPPPHRRHDSTTENQERELSSKADSLNGSNSGSHKPDGLFSAVARVVRSALKKLPAAVTARNLSREPIPAAAPNSSSSSPTATTMQLVPVAYHAAAATALVHRSSIKRPRERIDSHDEVATTPPPSRGGDSPGTNTSSSSTRITNNELVVTSPAAKRPRGGWYRIRAREPIARMRSERQVVPTSPRGASRETQRFQQGTLSIGDTFLPLPSRAHQSTQTED